MKFGCGITEIKNFEHQIIVVQLIPLLAQKWVGLKEINFTSSFQGAYISMYRKSINGYFSVFQTDTNKIISRILPCIRTQLRNWTEQYARTVNLRKITFSRIKLSTKKRFFSWAMSTQNLFNISLRTGIFSQQNTLVKNETESYLSAEKASVYAELDTSGTSQLCGLTATWTFASLLPYSFHLCRHLLLRFQASASSRNVKRAENYFHFSETGSFT